MFLAFGGTEGGRFWNLLPGKHHFHHFEWIKSRLSSYINFYSFEIGKTALIYAAVFFCFFCANLDTAPWGKLVADVFLFHAKSGKAAEAFGKNCAHQQVDSVVKFKYCFLYKFVNFERSKQE